MYICGAENITGKYPYLIADHRGPSSDSKGKVIENYIFGSIDQTKAWKVNLYLEPNLDPPDSESHNYLKIGDTIWIILSERKVKNFCILKINEFFFFFLNYIKK